MLGIQVLGSQIMKLWNDTFEICPGLHHLPFSVEKITMFDMMLYGEACLPLEQSKAGHQTPGTAQLPQLDFVNAVDLPRNVTWYCSTAPHIRSYRTK